MATRFVALGLDDRDLYILAGSLGAGFFVLKSGLRELELRFTRARDLQDPAPGAADLQGP